MKRGRWLIWVGLGTAAVIVGFGLFALAGQPWRQVARFPDGRVLTLAGTTYGEHRMDFDGWWEKLLRRVSPKPPPVNILEMSLSPEAFGDPLVFWFTQPAVPGRGSGRIRVASAGAPGDNSVLPWPEVVDEHGDSIGPLPVSRLQPIMISRGVSTLPLVAFPRRGKQVRVRFYRREPRVPLTELVAVNPDPGPHPVWTPERLPVRKSAGDLQCTLVELVTGLNRTGNKAGPGTPTRTRLGLRVERQAKPDPEWEPLSVELSDATGNRVRFEEGPLTRRGGDHLLMVPGALSPREAAWKLRVELARGARASFAPAETWTVRGVKVPGPGVFARLQARGRIGKVELLLDEATGPEGDRVEPQFRFSVKGKPAGRRITVLARDEQGRTYPGHSSAEHSREPLRAVGDVFSFRLPRDCRTVDLTFALQQSRFVEFLAKPLVP